MSLKVAIMLRASRKTSGPSFNPCEDHKISEGKKAVA
jgi:hypothetical protein